ncbi:SH3 domain-containing protein [Oceanobacter mangrovi]|uniref:SH3 domain-containing protein n=1 Tax=Oceanobacter mangrovi TaxID=2862510 RepID=UPI001C8E3EDC|nr:SH3 domain-containing protein [Oceanobacter mangrovi]
MGSKFKILIALLAVIAVFSPSTSYSKNCKKGIPCGNSCISASKVCRIGTYSTPNYSSPKYSTPGYSSPSTTQTPKFTVEVEQKSYLVNATSLNFRESPSSKTPVQFTLPKGTVIQTDYKSGQWVRTTHNGKSGWGSLDYLVVVQPKQPASEQPSLIIPSKGDALVVSAVVAQLRQYPNTESQLIYTLRKGDRVLSVQLMGEWRRVQHKSFDGWVLDSQLQKGTISKPLLGN